MRRNLKSGFNDYIESRMGSNENQMDPFATKIFEYSNLLLSEINASADQPALEELANLIAVLIDKKKASRSLTFASNFEISN